ncbi:hypothetical protein RJ641_028456 [Dillenia turbinata]|uniref:8-amino-7-oxononanoate synthase n=1 Tax=Dillenia turbinata TaxID=194707 RepID=A0AAN8ZJ19_9MAGN
MIGLRTIQTSSFTPTNQALFQTARFPRKKNSTLSFCKSSDAADSEPTPPEGDTRKQELLARIAQLQAQKVRLTDYLDERSTYLTKFAEEANAEFDKIGEDALRELDEAGARIMENINSQMQAFEESSELNRQEIERSEQNLLDFEEQLEKDKNEGLFFKNLRQKAPTDKAKAKEDAERITQLTKANAGSKIRKNIYLALISLLILGIVNALITSSDLKKVAALAVILVGLVAQVIYEQSMSSGTETTDKTEEKNK